MVTIVAIDDNKDNLISLKAIIQDAFPDSIFFSAQNGRIGIELAINHDPDVILLDIVMPEMDGFEVCQILKKNERTRDIPVVFLTAKTGSTESRIKALEVGAEAFLSKPIDEIELTAQIKAMVKIKLAYQQKRNEKEQLGKLVAERTRELEESQAETLQLLEELKAENESRKAIEVALRESEGKFFNLLNSTAEAIYGIDLNGNCTFCNNSFLEQMGYQSSDELLGKNMHNQIHSKRADGSHLDEKDCHIFRAFQNGENAHIDDEVLWRADGTCFHAEYWSYTQHRNGEIIGAVVTFVDITERKEAELALKESEQRYRLVFDDNLDAFIIRDPDQHIQSVNPAACEMFGRTKEEIFQLGRNSIIDFSDPRISAALEERTRTGKFFGELTGLRRDGTKFPIELSSTIFTDFKGNLRTSILIRDITERKQAEEKLIEEQLFNYAIIENLPGIFYLYTYPELQLIKWNKNHETMLGLTADELKSRFSVSWKRPEIKEHVISIMHDVAKNGYGQTETSFFKADSGSEIPFILTGVRLDMKDKTFIMGFGIDITDRKKAEAALRENEIRLRELVATKDKFFSIIAHDLKSPFNSIAGFSDLLIQQVQEKDYEGIEEYATIIQDSSQRVMNLLMNLLEWSRSKTGRMEYNPEFVELVGLINQAIELLSDAARQKSLNLKLETPRNTPVSADRAMISTVLRNLISNAVKFTQPGGEIIISLVQKQKEVTISVIDTGIGIKKELIKKLFKIEESYTTVGTQNEKGTGLGLILCKEFVEKHGGKIWAESEFEKGSKFSFTIPKLR